MEGSELALIESAFSKLKEMEDRFLKNERAYRSEYEKGTDGETKRTSRKKASDRSRSRLYVPLTKTTVDIIHALFKTSFMGVRCPLEVERIGQNSEHDRKIKNALGAALKKAWSFPEHRVGLSKAVLSAISQPLGIVTLFFDKSRKKIRTRFIPITDLAFDEDATDIFDAEYVSYKWKQSVREVEEKLKSGLYKKEKNANLYPQNSTSNVRVEMKDIYMRINDGVKKWELKSYCNGNLVRTARFSFLPFHFGYCLESMPSISEEQRDNELQMYGTSIPELVREIQTEYNIKRNQKIDQTENQIDPQIAIDTNAGAISISDLSQRKKFIRVETAQGKRVSDVITTLGEAGTYGITEEIAMLKSEYETTTGVNSILTGQTSPSDRRAMGALQTVNAASSMRVESMMQTLQDTMLHSYANHFVNLVWMHTEDEEFINLMEDETIIEYVGNKGNRQPLDFDIKINFGTTIGNDTKLNQLNMLLQTMLQYGQSNPKLVNDIFAEIMVLLKGETADTAELTTPQPPQESEPSLEEKEAAALARGGV